MSTIQKVSFNSIRPLHDHVLVKDMEFSERITSGGIIIPSDDGTTKGIRPRWAEVMAIGPKQRFVEVGEYVLIEHGRWTRGVTVEVDGEEMVIRRVDNDAILAKSDEYQHDDTFSEASHADTKKPKITEGSLHNPGTQNEIIL